MSPADIQRFERAPRLFPTNKGADTYNEERLLSDAIAAGEPVVHIHARHDGSPAVRRVPAKDAEGLAPVLSIAVGARVMIVTNLITSAGIVNGMEAIVRHIVYNEYDSPDTPGTMPRLILVEPINATYTGPSLTDDGPPLIPITPLKRAVTKQNATTHKEEVIGYRTQFPLRKSWGWTIHKCQGMTLDLAIVDLGEADFTSGLTYVALSRVRRLTDLLLEPFQWKRYESVGEGTAAVNFRAELARIDRLASNTRGRLRARQTAHS
jgi:ATP-dependent DNA helicase PIF1